MGRTRDNVEHCCLEKDLQLMVLYMYYVCVAVSICKCMEFMYDV